MDERDEFEEEPDGGGDADAGADGDGFARGRDDLASALAHDDEEEDAPSDEEDALSHDEVVEASAYDDDTEDDAGEEEEDDDEGAEVRTAVLWKPEMLALLSLKTGARGGLLVRVDPRQPLPTARAYEDSAAALRWFRRSLATSRRNGWQVVYAGAPLLG